MKLENKFWNTIGVSVLRGMFYAGTIVMGILLVLQQLDSGNIAGFRWFTILLSAVFAVEIFSGWSMHYKLSRQMLLKLENKPLLRAQEIFNHLVLPTNVFIWTLAFCYYNPQFHVRAAVLAATFTLLSAMFAYIRSFYLQQKTLLQALHAVFDLSKIYLFFLIVDSLLNFVGGTLVWTPILVAALAFSFNCLLIWREEKIAMESVYLNFFASLLLLAAIYVLLMLGASTVLQTSLLSLIGYYITAAIIHHFLAKDLTRQLVLEYILIVILAVIFLQGLS